MKQQAFDLLKEWCDTLLLHQIKEIQDENLNGALLCPACKFIHGRCADSVLPFVYLYSETGDEKYFEAAKLVIDWAENNVKVPSGGYRNDVSNRWLCTTAFFHISLGETLELFGDSIDKETYEKWHGIFVRVSEFMCDFSVIKANPHINYYCAWAHSMALAYKLLQDEKYLEKAKYWFEYSMEYITDDGFLYGEGRPLKQVSAKGAMLVDMGYNFEESLPALAGCARILGDKEALRKIENAILTHIEFILPDGALDNSFGTRNGKWTYYGSRTSDGCQTEFLNFDNPVIIEAALRNFLQYKACTHDGYLFGGPMYKEHGEPACIHHAFCHAKSLVHICLKNPKKPDVILPRDVEYGVKHFKTPCVTLVSKGKWRATIAHSDAFAYRDANPFGGALSLLYHMDLGVVCAASMTKYWLVEPNNFQLIKDGSDSLCSTVRIEDGDYSNLHDLNAVLDEKLCVTGKLCKVNDQQGADYSISYSFDDEFVMTVMAEADVKVTVPVVNYKKLSVKANVEYKIGEEFLSLNNGFVFTPMEFELPKGNELKITIQPR